jgi:hypothetical protein
MWVTLLIVTVLFLALLFPLVVCLYPATRLCCDSVSVGLWSVIQVGRKSAVAPKPALTIEYVQYHSESIQDLLKLSRVIPEMIKAQGLLDKEQRALLERSAEMDLQLKQAQALQKEMLGEITDLCSLWDIPMSPRVILKGRNPSTSSLGGLTKECSVCCESTSQHLMVCCDTCQSLYHIHCLDPPLDRVPKKTKTYGWQCEECCCCSDDEPPEPVAVTEVSGKRGRSTRTGRRVIKPKYYSSPWQPFCICLCTHMHLAIVYHVKTW